MVLLRGTIPMAKFKTRLSELMAKHGVERMDLVRQANMSYPTVMSWENDELSSIDANKVKALLEIFNCEMQDLIYLVDDAPVNNG
jgi:DNA-binding Xre family transcriptional regulator